MDKDPPSSNEPSQEPAPKPSILEELKRRKVFRVAATYAVVSWLVIQVASATFSDFGIPAWAFRFVVLMVLLGFPVAIVLAWAFELTPSGVRKTSVARHLQKGSDPAGLDRKRNWLAIGMAAALPTLIFGALALFFYLGNSSSTDTESHVGAFSKERPYVIGTIAVLPFSLISEDTDIKSTAEGLQDEMLTTLSEMDPLNVVSRTSTLRYGDFNESIPEIGKALGADYIVEGSIQTVGQKIRVTLQLIESANDNHVWAETFDRGPERADDLLLFQKDLAFELAIRIYQALEKTYPPIGDSLAIRESLLNDLSEQLATEYTRFWEGFEGDNRPEIEKHASILRLINEITHLDPDNPDAYDKYAGILYASTNVGVQDFYDPEWRKAFHLGLNRAYAVNPDGFDTNKHLGFYYFQYENQPKKAIPFSRKAVSIEEKLQGAAGTYTYWILLESLYDTGQAAAALRIAEEAAKENPALFDDATWVWSRAYQANRNPEKAIALLTRQREELEESAGYFYTLTLLNLAITEAQWTGSLDPLNEFAEYAKSLPEVPVIIRGQLAFYLGKFDEILDLVSEIQTGSTWSSLTSVDLTGFRGYAYFKTGNLALARSFLKGNLNELETSQQGRWMKQFQPDAFAARHAFAHACMGNRKDALQWAKDALQQADPARHFADYFETLYRLTVTYTILGEVETACGLIDQILSSPSGISTGNFLIDPQIQDISGAPEFEAVIRKHADQLKDPSILESIFTVD